MRTIRLLPVVVCAVGALLALKTIGLVTHGGYVLTGVATAEAAGAGSGAGGEIVLPQETTLADPSPTLADGAPTLPRADVAGEHARPGEGEPLTAFDVEGLAPEAVDPALASMTNCPAVSTGSAEHGGQAEACPPEGDAVPMRIDSTGATVPLGSSMDGVDTERALLERLAERRTELDAYADELEMRAAFIEAAEKRVEERAATMEALEAQIASLVEARAAAEEGLITGVVSMYESMRPRDAAKIFNELDMEVLLQVAKAMAPRKMAPILAEMNPTRAQELTVRLAAVTTQPADRMTANDLAALPQIVGQ